MTGCATMTADECKNANWSDLGFNDGLGGKPTYLLTARVNDCTKAGIRVDTVLYEKGRKRGLQNFCRLENAVPLGLSGQNYAGVCPAGLDTEFRSRYQTGYAVYTLRKKVDELNGRSDRGQRKLYETDKEEEKLLKTADKEDDRKRIRKEYADRHYRLSMELYDLDREMQNTRNALQNAEFSLTNLR